MLATVYVNHSAVVLPELIQCAPKALLCCLLLNCCFAALWRVRAGAQALQSLQAEGCSGMGCAGAAALSVRTAATCAFFSLILDPT